MADILVTEYDLVELMHFLVDTSVEPLDAAASGRVPTDGHHGPDARLDSENTELLQVLPITPAAAVAWTAIPAAGGSRSRTSRDRPR